MHFDVRRKLPTGRRGHSPVILVSSAVMSHQAVDNQSTAVFRLNNKQEKDNWKRNDESVHTLLAILVKLIIKYKYYETYHCFSM